MLGGREGDGGDGVGRGGVMTSLMVLRWSWRGGGGMRLGFFLDWTVGKNFDGLIV